MTYLDYLKNNNSLIIKDNFLYFNIVTKFSSSNGVAPLSSVNSVEQHNLLITKSLLMTIFWVVSAVIVALIFNSLVSDLFIKSIGFFILGLMAIYLIYDQFTNQIPHVLKLSIYGNFITFELKEQMPVEIFNQLKTEVLNSHIPLRKYWID
ncbi:MAG: hypothetical protein MK345_05025 [SAR202 cluster bacterium]|nr:hypothetical protein [SAR202 cluster bacterium]|tara:strand:- start:7926 stop:8378 length:453 start_codon:yes stop_codon:yes gene_type:complete